MTSKSFFSKLTRDEARRNLWALILSVVGFFFAAPLPVLIRLQQDLQQAEDLRLHQLLSQEENLKKMTADSISALLNENWLPRAGLMMMAVLCGIALFRYLHDRRQVDFYHALPVKRGKLFAVKYCAGLLLVLPAYLVMRLLPAVIAACMGFGGYIEWQAFLLAMAADLVAFFTVYSISVLCTILTGNTIIAVTLDLWALFSFAAVRLIWESYASAFYSTFIGAHYDLNCSPVLAFLQEGGGNGGLVLGYAVVAVLAAALSVFLFRIRRSERAGAAIAFEPFKLPLKAYVCLLVAAASGSFFMNLADTFWMWFGLLAGVVLTHWLVEIIYHFDFHAIFKHTPAMLALAAVAVVGLLGIRMDVFGYNTWIPKESAIEAVDIDNISVYRDGSYMYADYGNSYYYAGGMTGLSEPASVETVLELVQRGVDAAEGFEGEDSFSFIISYRLTGNRTAARQYEIPYNAEVQDLIDGLLFSPEYVKATSPAFLFDAGDEKPVLQVLDSFDDSRYVTVRDETQIDALIAALQADELALTPEQAAAEGPVLMVELGRTGEDAAEVYGDEVAVYPSYTETLALIERYTGMTPEPLDTGRVQTVRIRDGRERIDDTMRYMAVTVTDPEDIEALLEHAVNNDYSSRSSLLISSDVYLEVTLENGSFISLGYLIDQLPEEVIEKYYSSPLVRDK